MIVEGIAIIVALCIGYMAGSFVRKENEARGTFVEKEFINRVHPWKETQYPEQTEKWVNETMTEQELPVWQKYEVLTLDGRPFPGFNVLTVNSEDMLHQAQSILKKGCYLKRIE